MITPTTLDRLEQLRGLLAGLEPGRWLILTHDNPDPDSIASAAALSSLLRKGFGAAVTVAYGGLIGRAENREMVRSLEFRLSRVRHLSRRHYRYHALVDTQPRTGNNQLPSDLVPKIVFDHHPRRSATQKVPFVDIRTDYGATATILAEYLLASGLTIPRRLATAMLYAIRSETQDFARESSGPDKAIHDLLLPIADRRRLARIQSARLPLTYFRNLHRALEHMETVDTLIVSHLGEVDQPDIVPEIADLMLRMEGKTWSLCTGSHGDRLYLSVRTTNSRADAGNLMRRILGRLGKGGGHGMMAGGWVSLDRAPGGDQGALARRVIDRAIRLLGKKPERLRPIELL